MEPERARNFQDQREPARGQAERDTDVTCQPRLAIQQHRLSTDRHVGNRARVERSRQTFEQALKHSMREQTYVDDWRIWPLLKDTEPASVLVHGFQQAQIAREVDGRGPALGVLEAFEEMRVLDHRAIFYAEAPASSRWVAPRRRIPLSAGFPASGVPHSG